MFTYEVSLASDFVGPVHFKKVHIQADSPEEAKTKAWQRFKWIVTNVRLLD